MDESQNIYFASDFHLGMPNQKISLEREKKIICWLNHISKDAKEIYLLGDIFDFWFEYKKVIPKGFVRLLGCFAAITDSGIPIYIFPGNHDLWMREYLTEECGVQIIREAKILDCGKDVFFLHHGDGLGPGDAVYKTLKNIFKSKFAQWSFRCLHPDLGVNLAQAFSKKSRLAQNANEVDYLGDDKEFLTQFAKQHHTAALMHKDKSSIPNYYIFGHRHLVLDVQIAEGVKYINLGEWLHGQQYAVYDGSQLVIKKWDS